MTELLLTHALQRLYRDLGVLNTRKATGGSTTTIIDTTLKGVYSGSPFTDGVAFVARSTDGLAPQGEFERISKYDSSAQTFTLDSALSVSVGAGDVYSYADPAYPYLVMIDIINDALKALGMIDLVDDSTLTTAAEQTEYPASVAWKHARPAKIEYYSNPSDSNDRKPVELQGWDWVPAAAGSTGLIILPRQPFVGTTANPIRVWYRGVHPEVSAYNDKIQETVNIELLAAKALEKALGFQNKLQSGQDDALTGFLLDARREYDRTDVRQPQESVQPKAKTIDLKFPKYR